VLSAATAAAQTRVNPARHKIRSFFDTLATLTLEPFFLFFFESLFIPVESFFLHCYIATPFSTSLYSISVSPFELHFIDQEANVMHSSITPRFLLMLLAPFLIKRVSSEAQCPNLLATSIEGLSNFTIIVLGSHCERRSVHTATNVIYSTDTPNGYGMLYDWVDEENNNNMTIRDGSGALGVAVLDDIHIHSSRDKSAMNNVYWTVTSSESVDSLQINMSPAGIVIPYIEDDALKFRCGENHEGSSGG